MQGLETSPGEEQLPQTETCAHLPEITAGCCCSSERCRQGLPRRDRGSKVASLEKAKHRIMPHTPLLPPTGALELLEEKTIWKTAFSFSLAPLNANQRRRLKIPSKAGVRTADRENGGAERLQLPGRKRDWRRRAFLKNPSPDFPAPRLRFQPLLHKATTGAPRGVAGPRSAGAAGGTTPKLTSTPVLRALPDGTSRGTAVAIRPSSPAAHGEQSHMGSPAVHGTKRAAGDRRPHGHGGPAPGSAAWGARSARCIRAADTPQRGHRDARRLAGLLASARAKK